MTIGFKSLKIEDHTMAWPIRRQGQTVVQLQGFFDKTFEAKPMNLQVIRIGYCRQQMDVYIVDTMRGDVKPMRL